MLKNDKVISRIRIIFLLVTVIILIYYNIAVDRLANYQIIIILLSAIIIVILVELFMIKILLNNYIYGITKKGIDFVLGDSNESLRAIKKLNDAIKKINLSLDNKYKNESLKNQTEIMVLQSQINPHFLYNTLEVIRGKALIDGADEVAKMAKALGTLFRYCINVKNDLVTLGDEIDHIENYMLIQQYRFMNKYKFEKKDFNQELLDLKLPKLTLQPIVENCIVHGFKNRIGDGVVKLTIEETKRTVIINIDDNGVGIENELLVSINKMLQEDNEEKLGNEGGLDGIAIYNVNKRIKLLFGEEYGIQVYSSSDCGTDTKITVPKVFNK